MCHSCIGCQPQPRALIRLTDVIRPDWYRLRADHCVVHETVGADFDAADGFKEFGDGHGEMRIKAEGKRQNEEIFCRETPACAGKPKE